MTEQDNFEIDPCFILSFTCISHSNIFHLILTFKIAGDDGTQNEISFCAKISDEPGQLWVGPCIVPAFIFTAIFKTSYWILAYDEEERYAVISTRPKVDTEDGCESREGSGFWIFVRDTNYTNSTYNMAIEAAEDAGMSIDGLTDFYDVDYSSCNRED